MFLNIFYQLSNDEYLIVGELVYVILSSCSFHLLIFLEILFCHQEQRPHDRQNQQLSAVILLCPAISQVHVLSMRSSTTISAFSVCSRHCSPVHRPPVPPAKHPQHHRAPAPVSEI